MIDGPLLTIRLQNEVPKEVVVVPEVEVVPAVVADEVDSAHEAGLADEVVLGVVPVDEAVSEEGDNKVYQEDRCDRFSSFRFLWICTCIFIFDPIIVLALQGREDIARRSTYDCCMSINYHSMLLARQ